MDIQEAIYGRRAVREYTAEGVEAGTVRDLIDAAVHAPSAVNQQPWTFAVVRDRPLLDTPEFHIFYHAPVLVLISAIAAAPWFVEDCSLAAENLMLAAHAAGLGTCWIGFAQSFLNTPNGKAILGIPESWAPVAPIIVGRPKGDLKPVPRNPPTIRWIG